MRNVTINPNNVKPKHRSNPNGPQGPKPRECYSGALCTVIDEFPPKKAQVPNLSKMGDKDVRAKMTVKVTVWAYMKKAEGDPHYPGKWAVQAGQTCQLKALTIIGDMITDNEIKATHFVC